MLIGTALIFTVGAALYIWDFFRTRPRLEVVEGGTAPSDTTARARGAPA
jgi:hypothetical protein